MGEKLIAKYTVKATVRDVDGTVIRVETVTVIPPPPTKEKEDNKDG